MTHSVKIFDLRAKRQLGSEDFKTAERAYEEYVRTIKLIKSHLETGEEITVARYNDGMLMTFETIVGTN